MLLEVSPLWGQGVALTWACPLPGQCHFMVSSKTERYWILQQTLKPYFTINFLLKHALVSLRFPRRFLKVSWEVSGLLMDPLPDSLPR